MYLPDAFFICMYLLVCMSVGVFVCMSVGVQLYFVLEKSSRGRSMTSASMRPYSNLKNFIKNRRRYLKIT